MYKTILGIETSCDETGAAVLQQENGQIQILSNIVASSANLQAKFGGVIPEQAAREQLKSIIPVIQESLRVAGYRGQDIDAIAVTYGPGLIGSLLVGVETTKVLATIWHKPLIPVNHLIGHFYANWITSVIPAKAGIHTNILWIPDQVRDDRGNAPVFPCLGLLVSGGHTDLVLFKDHGKYKYLGGTRDDAAGECFDKCARLLGLPYPGGPNLSKLAQKGNPKTFNLPRPMIDSKDLDFSFSGLKTAVANLLKEQPDTSKSDLAASIEAAIVDVLIKKTVKAAQIYKVDQIIVAGGVSVNRKLREWLGISLEKLGIKLFIPPAELCTDNAAMIASAAFYQKEFVDPLTLQANPNLSLAY